MSEKLLKMPAGEKNKQGKKQFFLLMKSRTSTNSSRML